MKKSCSNCKFLGIHTREDGRSWLDVCEVEEPEEDVTPGVYFYAVIVQGEFDASCCLGFKPRVSVMAGDEV